MYTDRFDAGNKLAEYLTNYKDVEKIIFAIPNGGVPVGASIARKIESKMGLLIVRKLQIPYNPEAGFGAMTIDGTVIFNKRLMRVLHLSQFQIEQAISKVRAEIYDRNKFYGIDNSIYRTEINNKLIILTDDGIASGYTMVAAIKSVSNYNPQKILVAVPTAPQSSVDLVSEYAEITCPNIKITSYFSVASAYASWYDLNKDEVLAIIQELRNENLFM